MANQEMFKRILKQIEIEPKSFHMADWEEDRSDFEPGEWKVDIYNPNVSGWEVVDASECGTQRCVAGWAVFFEAQDKGIPTHRRPLFDIAMDLVDDYVDYEEIGADILDIDLDAASRLFHTDSETAYGMVKDYAEGKRG